MQQADNMEMKQLVTLEITCQTVSLRLLSVVI